MAKLLRNREKIATLPSEIYLSLEPLRQSPKLAEHHERTGHEAMGGREEFSRIKATLHTRRPDDLTPEATLT